MKKSPQYFYFINSASAFRARVKITKQQKALGLFTVAAPPQVFTPDGWADSIRFKGPEGIESFTSQIEAGIVTKVSMLTACTHVNGDIVLFAPTFSSRIASKEIN